MILKRSVQTKIFFGFISMLCANILMLILWILKINDNLLAFKISSIIGGILGFFLEKKMNIVQYDKFDNNNVIFFLFFMILLALLIIQTVFLPVR